MQNFLSAQHISANLNDYESARSGFFTLIVGTSTNKSLASAATAKGVGAINNTINDLALATETDKSSAKYTTGSNAQEILALNVVKAFVPHFSLEVHEYTRGNEKVKFAGVPTFESGSLTVDDVVGLDTKNILLAWQAQAYDVHTGKGGRMKDYKKNCTLMEYTQDYELIRQWELRGCWIKALSEDPFDKESDGMRKITVELEYDKAIPEAVENGTNLTTAAE